MRLIIRRGIIKTLIEMAKNANVEVCGFLLGRRNEKEFLVLEVKQVRNRLNSPSAFEMEPEEMVNVIDEAEERELKVVGIFHSHFKCPPVPSERDLEGMKLWSIVWLIVDNKGDYGAFVLENGRVKVVQVCIE